MKKFFVLIIPILIVILDQWSKYLINSNWQLHESYPVIEGFFNLTYVRNFGAAFSFGGNFSDSIRLVLFKIIPIIACLYLFWEIIKNKQSTIVKLAYAFILGGAIGNLIDRIRLDYVVDMLDFYYNESHFATFNVADSFITIAAFLLIMDIIINKKEK